MTILIDRSLKRSASCELAGHFISQIINKKRPIDALLESNISFDEIKRVIDTMLIVTNLFNLKNDLRITSKTINKLLLKIEESQQFMDIFTKIMHFSTKKKVQIFTYSHLQQLVLQVPEYLSVKTINVNTSTRRQNFVISNCFRKRLIICGLSNCTLSNMFEQINSEIFDWFGNTGKNNSMIELINWLCFIDDTGQLLKYKRDFRTSNEQIPENIHINKKTRYITHEDYAIQQEEAKKNGLCKYVRENKECTFGTNCKFYHGKIEDTYGIQVCRHGDNCPHLLMGDCKFVHRPSEKILKNAIDFYSMFSKNEELYCIDNEKAKFVDKQCKINPFIVLKKKHMSESNTYYFIPKCQCFITDNDGNRILCNKPVHFMTKNNINFPNFYCSHKHMMLSESNCRYYVKQNIVDSVFALQS